MIANASLKSMEIYYLEPEVAYIDSKRSVLVGSAWRIRYRLYCCGLLVVLFSCAGASCWGATPVDGDFSAKSSGMGALSFASLSAISA